MKKDNLRLDQREIEDGRELFFVSIDDDAIDWSWEAIGAVGWISGSRGYGSSDVMAWMPVAFNYSADLVEVERATDDDPEPIEGEEKERIAFLAFESWRDNYSPSETSVSDYPCDCRV